MFEGLKGFFSMVRITIDCFPADVIIWLLAIFAFILTMAIGKYLIDSL